jgi:glycosyltransferase involved in cell wall biosynthesis
MRIAFVGAQFAPTNADTIVGGASKSVERLSRALRRRGHEITIITSCSRFWPIDHYVADWARFRVFRPGATYDTKSYALEFIAKSLRALAIEKDYDIVHTHSGHPAVGLVSALVGLDSSVSTYHTAYCRADMMNHGSELQALANRFAVRCLFPTMLGGLFAVSNNVRESFRAYGYDRHIAVLPPPVEVKELSPSERKRSREALGVSPDRYVFLFVGSAVPQKGLRIVIDAAKKILPRRRDFLILAALHDPSELHAARRWLQDAHLSEHVRILGVVEEMHDVMAGSDCLVAPFLESSGVSDFPVAILEAMSLAKPVIAFATRGMRELASETQGVTLAHENDPDSICEKMLSLLEHPDVGVEMGDRASGFVRTRFSSDLISQRYEQIYRAGAL